VYNTFFQPHTLDVPVLKDQLILPVTLVHHQKQIVFVLPVEQIVYLYQLPGKAR